VSWWRKCFAIKCKEFTTKTLTIIYGVKGVSGKYFRCPFFILFNLRIAFSFEPSALISLFVNLICGNLRLPS
jgi:hypothetical protein